jgi:hypothetical protein
MTPPSPDSDRWVEFLRQHRPTPPAAAPDLEERILAAIAQAPNDSPVSRPDRPRQRFWTVPTVVVTLVLLVGGGWAVRRSLLSPAMPIAEADASFLTEIWYGSAYGDETTRISLNTGEPDWMLTVYATPY